VKTALLWGKSYCNGNSTRDWYLMSARSAEPQGLFVACYLPLLLSCAVVLTVGRPLQ